MKREQNETQSALSLAEILPPEWVNADFVECIDWRAVTTSKALAQIFGKEHKNVLQSIERLECGNDFRQLNFQPAKYKDEQGKRRPMYRLTRDGFAMIAFGFTGKKAAKFKEAFIKRFNDMEAWIKERKALRDDTAKLTDAIQAREAQTGRVNPYAYSNEQNLIYRIALGADKKNWLKINGYPLDDELRPHLSKEQLALVDELTADNATMIKLGMDFQTRKAKLEQMALMFSHKSQLKA